MASFRAHRKKLRKLAKQRRRDARGRFLPNVQYMPNWPMSGHRVGPIIRSFTALYRSGKISHANFMLNGP